MKKKIMTEGGRLMGIEELSQYLGVGLTTAKRFGRENKAVVNLGSRVLYDRVIIDAAIDREHQKQGESNVCKY